MAEVQAFFKRRRSPRRLLRDEQVREIVERHGKGERMRPLGREFGVSWQIIQNIIHGRYYREFQVVDLSST